jgi:pyrroline-5-carboxylate reductase
MEAVRLDRIGPLWLVGCGHMGGALLDRWLACGLDADSVTVIDPSPRSLPAGIRVVGTPQDAGDPPNVVLLAIKPQLLADVAAQLADLVAHRPLVISILAGGETATLRRRRGSPSCSASRVPTAISPRR